jgi:uncharacterized C2H2 Zn-finger protein
MWAPNFCLVVLKKQSKMTTCPHCSKTYKQLKQHITKVHTTFEFKFNPDNTLTVYRNGELILNNNEPEADDDEGGYYYCFQLEDKVYRVSHLHDGTVVFIVSRLDKHRNEIMTTAYKNWKLY